MAFTTVQFAEPVPGPNNVKDVLLLFLLPFVVGYFLFGIWCGIVVMFVVLAIVNAVRTKMARGLWISRFEQAKAHIVQQGFQVDYFDVPRLMIDARNRKIALLSPQAGLYEFFDFSDILSWEHRWIDKTTPRRTMITERVVGTKFTQENNTLIIKTKNPDNPIYEFPIGNHANGQLWHARLSALLKG